MTHPLALCMFCLKADGAFQSREHVIPESMGNQDTLLPKGFICDRCNNGPLSVCDSALVQFPPFALLKTSRRIPNKKNRLPRAVFGSTGFYAMQDGDDDIVYVRIPDETTLEEREGAYDVRLVARWSVKQWQLVSRALLKMGLEMLAVDNGKEYVMDERFDGLRRAVPHGRYAGFVSYTQTSDCSGDDITLDHPPFQIGNTGRTGLMAGLSVFGSRISTMWPGLGGMPDRPPQIPDVPDLRIVRFPRDPPKRDSETVTIQATVSYGSRGEDWDESSPMGRAIAEIERHAGN